MKKNDSFSMLNFNEEHEEAVFYWAELKRIKINIKEIITMVSFIHSTNFIKQRE